MRNSRDPLPPFFFHKRNHTALPPQHTLLAVLPNTRQKTCHLPKVGLRKSGSKPPWQAEEDESFFEYSSILEKVSIYNSYCL